MPGRSEDPLSTSVSCLRPVPDFAHGGPLTSSSFPVIQSPTVTSASHTNDSP
eukprot:CAMPEP_0169463172 /NCGR_PEP_ID=MMETSP1042-20121227/19956_1 /TAXON_ID=464988 /ORGANISM="Hemiselmis andersenii, Strain CCMP1180" /LENGTH=51 /DNA_ID=CAMNT_0009575867 /DNA_START=226 /DNA_END=378 /DNA_ORIENTATION=-